MRFTKKAPPNLFWEELVGQIIRFFFKLPYKKGSRNLNAKNLCPSFAKITP